MMVLRAIAFLGMASASACDEVVMIQRNAEVNSIEMPLQPRDAVLPENISALKDVPGMLILNLTDKDLQTSKKNLLLALKSKAYIGTLYFGLKNWTTGMANFSNRLVGEAQKLMGESTNATVRRTYFLLEHYTLVMDNVMAELAGATVDVMHNILDQAPPSAWRNSTYRARKMMANLTKDKVTDYLASQILRPHTKKIFDQKSMFCARFMLAMSKNVDIDQAISAMVPGMAEAKHMLPMLGPYINAIVPGVQGDVMRLSNTTLDASAKTLQGLNLAYHLMTKVMIEVASHRLNCTMPHNNTAVLDVARKEESGHCALMEDSANAVCAKKVNWAMSHGKSDPLAEEWYGPMESLVGVPWQKGTADDFHRYFHCKRNDDGLPEVKGACNLPPCTCTKPPCDVCLSQATAVDSAANSLNNVAKEAAAAVIGKMAERSSAPAPRGLAGLALAFLAGAWLVAM
uniref:Uncharacterized protein n=1 Tax=Alexandrium catenella TaxID=2925 RepID=A0A7S1MLY7_ALECA|mmetsp:Transcript_29607/g.79984  ORF Transcript_29607/g.79984 Transcript_29607/m.79984 type:complete len:458 (+) Transcript_29607:70-1443(+)